MANLVLILKNYLIAWIIVALFASTSCIQSQYQSPDEEIKSFPADYSNLIPLEIGDWVLRMGKDTDSHLIRQISKGRFSHIGIVVEVEPAVKIVHAIHDENSGESGVLYSDLQSFVAPNVAEYFAVLRMTNVSKQQQKNIVNHIQQQIGQPFILNTRQEKHLYCTTLIYDAILQVKPDFSIQWSKVNFPPFSGEYLFPLAFEQYSQLEIVYSSETSK